MVSPPYQPRLADVPLATLLSRFAAVMVQGPRAAGKSTSAARLAAEVLRLDVPARAAAVRADPDAALKGRSHPLLIDEWQEVPEVLGAVKRQVDRDRTPGQFIMTGSVRPRLMQQTWPGTGRLVRVPIYGLTEREVNGRDPAADGFLKRLAAGKPADLPLPEHVPDLPEYVQLALRGGFPELALWSTETYERRAWLDAYVDELLGRDALAARARSDVRKLRKYLTVISLNTAGAPSNKTIYDAARVSATTAQAYDELLSDLFVVDQVAAWSTRRVARLTRSSKRYLIDPALAAAAAGVAERTVLDDGDLLGRVIDTFCAAQLRPEAALSAGQARLHHLRAEGGRHEVDIVVEYDDARIVGLEFKATTAPTPSDARHLAWLRDRMTDRFTMGIVLHTGPERFELSERIYALPICAMWG